MFPGAQSPAHPRGAAQSPQSHLAPWSAFGRFGQPGHSDQDPDAECYTETHGQEAASPGPAEAPGSGGGRNEAPPFPLLPVATHSSLGLPALAGKELTSRLLSVNVELLIPTAKPVCWSSHWSRREQGAQAASSRL